MITVVDNTLNIFQVVGRDGSQIFCNFCDLNKVCTPLTDFKIYRFWNNKPRRAPSKLISDMYAAARIVQTFKY